MNLLENIQHYVKFSGSLEQVVRKYGADFLSTYGTAALVAVGVMLSGGHFLGPTIAAAAAVGLVCGVNKLIHDCRELELLETYRDQIASSLSPSNEPGKIRNPEALTTQDLRDFVRGENTLGHCSNNLLRREVETNDRRMWINIGLHCLSGGIFVGAVGAIEAAKYLSLDTLVGALSAGAGTMVLFPQIDTVVSDIGRTLTNVNPGSAHERIMNLESQLHSGQYVHPLQVFMVMVDGDKDLQEKINKRFGINFEHLYLDEKNKAMEEFGYPRGVREITLALNRGTMEAEDLVLALCDLPAAQRHAAIVRLHKARAAERAEQGQEASPFDLSWLDFMIGSEKHHPSGSGVGEAHSTFFQDKLGPDKGKRSMVSMLSH